MHVLVGSTFAHIVTVTPHECHCAQNHRQIYCLLTIQRPVWADNKEYKKALIICDPVVGGSPPCEPTHTTTDVKGKCFPCHGIIKYNAEMQWKWHLGEQHIPKCCHMGFMGARISNSSTVCSTVCHGLYQSIYYIHCWPFVMGIHRWLVDSYHKGSVRWEAFLCQDGIINMHTV